ncbi:transmembrane protein 272-like isoform X1 [Haliotis asinina]|uniref:transmembrane protein 272-like isoform X1 n=1 Tax=Haliotis asinina TaxID=109174 RepID=UPI0035326F1B
MSMLTRKGTLVRPKRGTIKKSQVSRTRSGGTGKDASRGLEEGEESPGVSTPVQSQDLVTQSPGKSTVVCFDDNNQLYQTGVRWPARTPSTDQPIHGEVFLQIREANKEADDTKDFVCRVTDIFCNSLFFTVLIVVLLIIPTAMVSAGVKYLSDCPVQPKIPVYLMVGGCFGILKLVGMWWRNVQIRRYESMDAFYDAHDNDAAFASHTFKLMDAMLSAFLLGWQITGTYWVFTIYEPNYKPLLHEPSNWCEKTVFMIAFIQILGCYGLLCLGILVLLLVAACYKYTDIFDK